MEIMKKIIVLGAGIYQVPLIKTAQKLGLYVIVVSIPGEYPGFTIADQVCLIDTTDREAVLAMARKEEVSAIVTTGTDVAVSTIGYVCDNMKLSGISYESAVIATDKALMKQAFQRGGVSTAPFCVISSYENAKKALEQIGLPAMLKIVDKSGSRGITKLEVATDLKGAYEYAEHATNAQYMVLEKYIEGKEIGVDAFVQNGEVKLVLPHDKIVYQTGRTGIPSGHICPMNGMTESLRHNIEEETIKAIHAMKLDNCAVNLDVFVTPQEEIYVIEAAGRCGATGIPEVLSGYLNIDYYEMIIRNALGQTVGSIQKDGRPTGSMLIHSKESGKLKSIEYIFEGVQYRNEDSLRTAGGYVQLDHLAGTEVHAFENGTHRIGQAIFHADTVEELLDHMDRFRSSVMVDVEKHEP